MLQSLKKGLYLAAGLLSVALGVIGIFLPLLPTTPFLLLAAFCFSHSSETLHRWLLEQKHLGPIIKDWEKHGVIRLRIKWIATLTMLALVSYPLFFKIEQAWLQAILLITIASVLVFIWTRPSHYPDKGEL